MASIQEKSFDAPTLLEDGLTNDLSSLTCSSIPEPEFNPLSLTPPASPQLICQTSGDFSMSSPIDSPTATTDDFAFLNQDSPLTQSSFWLEDLKTLGHGHVQKLVDSWEEATKIPGDLEPLEFKKGNVERRRPIVQSMIEYWEAKEKEVVLVSCSGAPGHAQCSGSSLDTQSRIHCSHCSPSIEEKKSKEVEQGLLLKLNLLLPVESAQRSTLPESLRYTSMLPEESFEREPRFVNPKQYHRILKRRQQRAKYFQNHVVVKQVKPYKHQSRHEHANRRLRGQGGRFLKRQEKQVTPVEPEFSEALDPFMSDVFSFGALAA